MSQLGPDGHAARGGVLPPGPPARRRDGRCEPAFFDGCPGLIFHGPMQAAFLVELAAKLHRGAAPKKFSYRGVQPLFEGSEFSINANDTDAGMELWTANSAGQPTMKGTATW